VILVRRRLFRLTSSEELSHEEFAKAVEKEIIEFKKRLAKGEIRISEERIITPDQKRPHQWGYF